MPKSKSERADMFSLLAGGLEESEPTLAPEAEVPPTPVEAAPVEAAPVAPVPVPAPAVPLQPAVEVVSPQVTEPTSKRKKRKKTGKRSDDAYMQTGMFLPVELVQKVKGYLAFDGNRQTIGDLTEGLLQTWADEKKAELAKRLSE